MSVTEEEMDAGLKLVLKDKIFVVVSDFHDVTADEVI